MTARKLPSSEKAKPSTYCPTFTVLTIRGAFPFRSITLTGMMSPALAPWFPTTAISPLELIWSAYGRKPPVITRFVSVTLVPSTDRTEILWSPSRVTSAILPSGEKTTLLGPDFGSPKSTFPAEVSLLPEIVNIETVPSLRLATKASVPARFIDVPVGPRPGSSVAITAGGLALRSITESLLSGTCFFGSAGSSFILEATRANDSSGAMATFCGGPTTLDGVLSSAMTFGGETPRLMMVTVSSTGLADTLVTPLTRTDLPSLEDTAICAKALTENKGKASTATAMALARETRNCMIIPPGPVL